MGRLDLSTRFAVACICTSVLLTAQSDIDNDVIMNKKRNFNRVMMIVKMLNLVNIKTRCTLSSLR